MDILHMPLSLHIYIAKMLQVIRQVKLEEHEIQTDNIRYCHINNTLHETGRLVTGMASLTSNMAHTKSCKSSASQLLRMDRFTSNSQITSTIQLCLAYIIMLIYRSKNSLSSTR